MLSILISKGDAMKCPKCNYELTPGSICCPQCKNPVTQVPSHNSRKNITVIIIASIVGAAVLIVLISLFFRNHGHKNSTRINPSNAESQITESAKRIVDDRVIYEKNGIKIVFTGYDIEKSLPEISFQIENNSKYDIYISSDNLSINDYMIPRGLLCKVAAGKKAIDNIVMFSSDLSDCDITNISKIEFALEVTDSNSYIDSPIEDKETIIIDF